MFKPRAAKWIVGRRHEKPKEMIFEGGFKIALPDQYLMGNNNLNQDYRIVDVLAVASNMEGWEDIKVGDQIVLHELDSLKLSDEDPNLITFGAEVVQAIVEKVNV